MRLEEKHKEFAVKGYTCFMKLSEILENFMIVFAPNIAEVFLEDHADKLDNPLTFHACTPLFACYHL